MKPLWKTIYHFLEFISTFTHSVPKDYSSYRAIPLCTPSDYIRYPTTTKDVIGIVQEAIRRNITVKAFGARHSQTDIICTEGIPIDNRGLQSFRMNKDNTVTFGSGVTLFEATEFLRQHGRAFKTTPAFGNITLGGAIGTGAHGSSIKYTASLSSQVVRMTIVDGFGKLRTISDETELNAFRIHLGVLGILIDVTLTTTPLYKTMAYNYMVPDTVLTDGRALEWAKSADQMSLYWFPNFNKVVVANWTIVDVSTPGNAKTNDHVPSSTDDFNLFSSKAMELASTLATSNCSFAVKSGNSILHVIEHYMKFSLLVQTPQFVPIYTDDETTLKMPAVGYYDKMFAPVCNDEPLKNKGDLGCIWAHGNIGANITILDNEFGLALRDLPAFIRSVKDIIKKTPTSFPLQGILMRFSAASPTYMSTAYGRDTVHFEFYLWNRKDTYNDPSNSLAGYQTILQTLAKQFNGRSHWGKSGLVYHNSESLTRKLDPNARRRFVDMMNKYDPNEVFINNFGRRLKGTGTRVDFDPKITRCALLDNCFCSSNFDCGVSQTCTQLQGYDYNVCKTRSEDPEEPIDETHLPPVNEVLGYLSNMMQTVVNASRAQCPEDSIGHIEF